MEPQMDLTKSPGMGVCDRCERIKPLDWFGLFWLCDECTLRALDAIGVEAFGRGVERLAHFLKRQDDLLDRALEIIESAYGTLEWTMYARTARTDETMELIVKALGPKLEPRKEPHGEQSSSAA